MESLWRLKLITANIKHVIKGSWDIASQYHYTMETHTCFAVMMEDHMEVYPSSQSPTSIQTSISYALNLPGNEWVAFLYFQITITMIVRIIVSLIIRSGIICVSWDHQVIDDLATISALSSIWASLGAIYSCQESNGHLVFGQLGVPQVARCWFQAPILLIGPIDQGRVINLKSG